MVFLIKTFQSTLFFAFPKQSTVALLDSDRVGRLCGSQWPAVEVRLRLELRRGLRCRLPWGVGCGVPLGCGDNQWSYAKKRPAVWGLRWCAFISKCFGTGSLTRPQGSECSARSSWPTCGA